MFESISVIDLKNMNFVNLIDIRSVEKYNSNHIMNAINVPLEQLLLRPEKYLNKNVKYYIYCQKGIQSRKLCPILINKGFKVVNVNGGYESWILNE